MLIWKKMFCFTLAHVASEVHTTKNMQQAWSKWSRRRREARYQKKLIFLLHVLRLLHSCFTCVHTVLASASASQVWTRLYTCYALRSRYKNHETSLKQAWSRREARISKHFDILALLMLYMFTLVLLLFLLHKCESGLTLTHVKSVLIKRAKTGFIVRR